jgi:hypothetical protein
MRSILNAATRGRVSSVAAAGRRATASHGRDIILGVALCACVCLPYLIHTHTLELQAALDAEKERINKARATREQWSAAARMRTERVELEGTPPPPRAA